MEVRAGGEEGGGGGMNGDSSRACPIPESVELLAPEPTCCIETRE